MNSAISIGGALDSLFITGIDPAGNFTELLLWHSLWLTLLCALAAYLIAIVLLQTRFYSARDVGVPPLDADVRVRLGFGWGLIAIMVSLLTLIAWLWYQARLPYSPAAWRYVLPLSGHWVALILLAGAWALVTWNVREELARARRRISGLS